VCFCVFFLLLSACELLRRKSHRGGAASAAGRFGLPVPCWAIAAIRSNNKRAGLRLANNYVMNISPAASAQARCYPRPLRGLIKHQAQPEPAQACVSIPIIIALALQVAVDGVFREAHALLAVDGVFREHALVTLAVDGVFREHALVTRGLDAPSAACQPVRRTADGVGAHGIDSSVRAWTPIIHHSPGTAGLGARPGCYH
jgi:hypothetical protein